ncbi:hypothetical protein KC19_VG147200 [Ceratodon purpureus]|uniref:Uncharacterized protein n=1 Tax=Ceratodon purpureus TaxID=3225 RepID=A0A8T0HQ45_CERPU|nr:hypothetical protein KC19_VG147200 [Ceratodon purpureus]
MRRPPSSIQSVILFTSKDDSDHWIPTKYEVGSWISLHPGERVLHAQESKRYGGTSLSGAYKARIVEFRVEGLRVSQVRVQHAYMYRQLKLDPAANQIHGACNYLYPSKFEDCVDPNSILGIIVVVHADIGEATRGIRTHKDLLGESLFFYNAFYILPQATGRYGQVVSIPLPPLDSLDWPLPDMATSEAFRSKFRNDILLSMKASTGSRINHLQL